MTLAKMHLALWYMVISALVCACVCIYHKECNTYFSPVVCADIGIWSHSCCSFGFQVRIVPCCSKAVQWHVLSPPPHSCLTHVMNKDLGHVFRKSVIHMDWMSVGTWTFNQTFVSKLKRQDYVKHCAVRKFFAYCHYGNSQQIPAYFVLASKLKENL